jgi:hypothetical protein
MEQQRPENYPFGDHAILPTMLMVSVPLRIAELEARGGPQESDWAQLREFSEVLGCQGDRLLYREGTSKGEPAKLFNQLTHALVVMAFVPGGVRAFGCLWASKMVIERFPNVPEIASLSQYLGVMRNVL